MTYALDPGRHIPLPLRINRFVYTSEEGTVHCAFFLGRIGAAWDDEGGHDAATKKMGGWVPGQKVVVDIWHSNTTEVPS